LTTAKPRRRRIVDRRPLSWRPVRRDFFEIHDDHGRRRTIVASPRPVPACHDVCGDPPMPARIAPFTPFTASTSPCNARAETNREMLDIRPVTK
jgi:hypothetical protein